MLTLYLIGLAAGSLLILLSLIGGGDEADSELEADGDVDVDVDAHGDADADADAGHGAHHGDAGASTVGAAVLEALPLASLRFWTFFLAFGGLTGALLTGVSNIGALATAICAAVVGYGSGLGVTTLHRLLRRSQISSTLPRDATVGVTGTVLLPIAQGSLGRIRVHLENQVLDFDADTDDEASLEVSEPAVVYEMRDDGVVLVTSARTIQPLALKGKLS